MSASASIAELEATLRSGDVVVVPTDTVYGLAAMLSRPDAVAKLYELKRRPAEKRIAVLVGSIDQASELADLSGPALELAHRLWPGPLTIVLPADEATRAVTGEDTIGIRWPDAPLLEALAQRLGPLATTSANRSGDPTPTTLAGVRRALETPDLVGHDGGICAGEPSTVVSFVGSRSILREGALTTAQLDGE